MHYLECCLMMAVMMLMIESAPCFSVGRRVPRAQRYTLRRSAFFVSFVFVASPVRTGASSCSVRDFGAEGNNRTDDTSAIQAALRSCAKNGNVVFPSPGLYLTKPFVIPHAAQNLTIVVQAGATVVAWGDIKTWPRSLTSSQPLFQHFDPQQQPIPLISVEASNASVVDRVSELRSITICGGGTIDGQGWRWWPLGPFPRSRRPSLLSLSGIIDLQVHNLTLRNSPVFHLYVQVKSIFLFNNTLQQKDSGQNRISWKT